MCCAVLGFAVQAETIDRIAVTVGKDVITESEILHELRISAFLDRRSADLSTAAKRKAASRLVDQILLLREASEIRLPVASPEDAQTLLDGIRASFGGSEEYQRALTAYDVRENDLRDHLIKGVEALRFSELRFHSAVPVSEDALHSAYDKLVATWSQSRPTAPPSFEESRPELERLLTTERMMDALDEWLESIREEAHIVYREAVFP